MAKARLTNLYQRYEATVSLLKEHGWWTLRSGQYFHTLIIHTLPPPSLKHLSQLLTALAQCQFNSDWAPLQKTLYWRDKIDGKLAEACEDELLERLGHIGEQFPVFYGIRGFNRLGWPTQKQSALTEEFVQTIFNATRSAERLHLKEYYHDVYQIRDVLIDRHAESKFPVGSDTRTNLADKIRRAETVIHGARYPGSHPNVGIGKRGPFSEDPPFVPFLATAPPTQPNDQLPVERPKNKEKHGGNHELLDPPDTHWSPDPNKGLATHQQFEACRKVRATYLRGNVRSLADPNQLTLTALVAYWRQLVETMYQPLLAVGLMALLTGIRGERWLNLITGERCDLTESNLVLIPESSLLIYRVINGASNFSEDNISPSEVMQLALSKSLADDLRTAVQTDICKKKYSIRTFTKSFPGPSPTLNRIANSGETLLRRQHFSESEMGLLAGNVPIQFRARNCYVSRDRESIGATFEVMRVALWDTLKKHHLKPNAPLFSVLTAYLGEPISPSAASSPLGSQLGDLKTCSPPTRIKPPTIMMRPDHRRQVDEMMQAANLLELHLYWMQQYAFAQRPVGAASSSITHDGYRLHADKDSAHYSESKLIKVPERITQQIQQNQSCRSVLIEQLRRFGHRVVNKAESPHKAWYFERSGHLDRRIVSSMVNAQALDLAKRFWGHTPAIDRPNLSRHHCATVAHSQSGEVLADIWLGHHIDGWDPYAPESTLASNALDSLQQLQAAYLSRLGFEIMRNPLS